MAEDALNRYAAPAPHNLKNVDVTIPRDKLTVITGLSGSGQVSLAFGHHFRRRSAPFTSSRSRRMPAVLGLMEKPDVDAIEGLSPAISDRTEDRGPHNPRSTVGTVTEIHDYLRLL